MHAAAWTAWTLQWALPARGGRGCHDAGGANEANDATNREKKNTTLTATRGRKPMNPPPRRTVPTYKPTHCSRDREPAAANGGERVRSNASLCPCIRVSGWSVVLECGSSVRSLSTLRWSHVMTFSPTRLLLLLTIMRPLAWDHDVSSYTRRHRQRSRATTRRGHFSAPFGAHGWTDERCAGWMCACV